MFGNDAGHVGVGLRRAVFATDQRTVPGGGERMKDVLQPLFVVITKGKPDEVRAEAMKQLKRVRRELRLLNALLARYGDHEEVDE